MAVKTHIYEGEKALAEVLFNSIGDGAVTTDEFGKITRINPTAQKIVGYSKAEAIGKWFPDLFSAYDDDGFSIPLIERPVTRAFISGQIISERIRYKTKGGKMIPVSVTNSPIMVQGNPVGCIEIFRDITKEYEIEKMKSDFISLASHQLRTPLSAVKTYSHMLLDGFMGPMTNPQRKSLKTIVSAANRMNETVSTLLNITRIESGSVAVSRKPIAINRVIDEVIDEHSIAAAEKDIQFKINKPPEPIKIVSDNVVLKEVVGNLVSNAIKYTPIAGKITLSVDTKGNQAIISIHDNGMGIPKLSQANVFTKFFRADNVVKQETFGIGLGLYMVKGLVTELGGDVWFKSIEGKGSTFYVALPLLPQTIRPQTVNN